jgi:hypothetical protein
MSLRGRWRRRTMLQTTAERGLPQVVCKVMATADRADAVSAMRDIV